MLPPSLVNYAVHYSLTNMETFAAFPYGETLTPVEFPDPADLPFFECVRSSGFSLVFGLFRSFTYWNFQAKILPASLASYTINCSPINIELVS